jgi:hypothetical protein
MTRPVQEIAADIDSLSDSDFDPANTCARGYERLYSLCDELQSTNIPALCVPVLFRTMERLNNEELGDPGPLVHTLESWPGSYEATLTEVVGRNPGRLSIWMVNRILNTDPPDTWAWLDLLQRVANNSSASAETRAQAAEFIKRAEQLNVPRTLEKK